MLETNVQCAITISKRAKHLRLHVYSDGTVRMTVPHYYSLRKAKTFLQSKETWIKKHLAYYAKEKNTVPPIHVPSGGYTKLKESARTIITKRVQHVNQHYQLSFGRIAIRNQKTCWGSCSEKGNLNFNYRVAFLPDHVRDYVVVHELCHLKHFNHSPAFWQLVAEMVPNYQEIRKELHRLRLV